MQEAEDFLKRSGGVEEEDEKKEEEEEKKEEEDEKKEEEEDEERMKDKKEEKEKLTPKFRRASTMRETAKVKTDWIKGTRPHKSIFLNNAKIWSPKQKHVDI